MPKHFLPEYYPTPSDNSEDIQDWLQQKYFEIYHNPVSWHVGPYYVIRYNVGGKRWYRGFYFSDSGKELIHLPFDAESLEECLTLAFAERKTKLNEAYMKVIP